MIGTPGTRAVRQACCSAWTHPLTRLLLGERLHPGGAATTAATVAALGLPPGAVVLDVGCGPGLGLRALTQAGLVAVGIDAAIEAVVPASEAGVAVVGEAERLPLSPGCADGAMAECVLSLVTDKPAALRELRRVVRSRGRMALSDVTREGDLPLALDPVAAWSACVGGALAASSYVALLRDAGFVGVEVTRLDHELMALLEQVRRRLALAEMAVRAGRLDLDAVRPGLGPGAFPIARELLSLGVDAVERGILGYELFTATRP